MMHTFEEVSVAERTIFLMVLFIITVITLALVIIAFDRRFMKKARYVNIVMFVIMCVLLIHTEKVHLNMSLGSSRYMTLNMGMPLMWLLIACATVVLMLEFRMIWYQQKNRLSRNSIRMAIDTMPEAVCYFDSRGRIKLCNYKMYDLFQELAGSDLQKLSELEAALVNYDAHNKVQLISDERQTYLFPDGKAWRYSQKEVTDRYGCVYTESVFSDMTELYNKTVELKSQSVKLREVSRKLKRLSDNVLILTREREILEAKTRLHDQMGAGLTAVRQVLGSPDNSEISAEDAAYLLSSAVNTLKDDNAYSMGRNELDRFLEDADTIGIKVNLEGNLHVDDDILHIMVIAMRESMTNAVRHAGASEITVKEYAEGNTICMDITNDGRIPQKPVAEEGGLKNLRRHVEDCGGEMTIQSEPFFRLTVTLPASKGVD